MRLGLLVALTVLGALLGGSLGAVALVVQAAL